MITTVNKKISMDKDLLSRIKWACTFSNCVPKIKNGNLRMIKKQIWLILSHIVLWIGQNATILPGVHIGDGAIIGANSVIGSDVDPYTIVVGNPARPIRKRFDEELIDIMEKLKWWDKSIEEINNLIPLLTSSDLEKVKQELLKLV